MRFLFTTHICKPGAL